MPKSIYAIAALGLGSCLVLSLMMQHLLGVQHDKEQPPIVQELDELFGSRLERMCTLEVHEGPDDVLVRVRAFPADGMGTERFAADLGRHTWRRVATQQVVDRLEVVFADAKGRDRAVHAVPAPPMARRVRREPPPEPRKPEAVPAAPEPSTSR